MAQRTPDGYVPVYQDTIDAFQGHGISVDPGVYDVFAQEERTGILLRLNDAPLELDAGIHADVVPPGAADILRILRERHDRWTERVDRQFGQDPGSGYIQGDLLLKFLPDTPLSAIHALLASQQGVINDRVQELDVYHVSFDTPLGTAALLRGYRSLPEVEHAELNLALTLAGPQTADPRAAEQHHLATIGAEAAWQYFDENGDGVLSQEEAPGRGAVIAILDTGVDLQHPDLEGNLWHNPNETLNYLTDDSNALVDDIWGWDYAEDKNSPIDASGHGTHVAGIAAAVANNSEGGAGVAWGARIMAVKITTRREPLLGTHITFISTLVKGIIYASAMGADVMNISSGTFASIDSDILDLVAGDGLGNTFTLALATEFAWNLGTLVVASAGNQATDTTNDLYIPADLPYVVSVGATDGDARASFSNYGGSLDLSAPGVGILSSHILPYRYVAWDGTSMAAPIVAGVAALLRSKVPSLTPSEIQGILKATADEIGPTAYTNGRNDFLGHGRVNAAAAMAFLYNEPVITLSLDTSSGQATAGVRLSGTVTDYFGLPIPDTVVAPVKLAYVTTETVRTLSSGDLFAVVGSVEPNGSLRTDSFGQFEVAFSMGTEDQPAPGGVVLVAVDSEFLIFVVTPSLVVTRQATGQPGPIDLDGSYSLVGTGYYPASGVTVTYNGSPATTSIVTDSNGAFAWPFSFNANARGGTSTLEATAGDLSASVEMDVLARLAVSPASGSPGDEITVIGSGFGSFEAVSVAFDSTVTAILLTDASGALSGAATVPNLPPGAYRVAASSANVRSATVDGFSVLAGGLLVHASAPGQVRVGEVFDFEMFLSGDTPLAAVAVAIGFDVALFEYVDAGVVGAHAADGALIVNVDTPGMIGVGIEPASAPASFEGAFVTLRFRALEPGSTAVEVGAVILLDGSGNDIPSQVGLPVYIEVAEPLRVAAFLVLGAVYAEDGSTLAPDGLDVTVTNVTQNWSVVTAVGGDGHPGLYQVFSLDFGNDSAAASGDRITVTVTDDGGVVRAHSEVRLTLDDLIAATREVNLVTDIEVAKPHFALGEYAIDEPDGDGVAEPGEHVELTVTIENTGTLDGEDVTLTLGTANTYIVIDAAQASLSVWPVGDGYEIAFSFDVDAAAPTLTANFSITAHSANGAPQELDISVPIVAGGLTPKFALRNSWIFDPVPEANGNSVANSGERVFPRVRIINEGVGVAQNVIVTLLVDDPDVAVVNGAVTHSSWPAAVARNNNGLALDISPDAATHDVAATVRVTSDSGGPWQFDIVIPVMRPPVHFVLRNAWLFLPTKDGEANRNDRVEPRIRLLNEGDAEAQNVRVALDVSDSDVSIVAGEVAHATWPSGVARNNNGLALQVSNSATEHDVAVVINVTADNGGPWQFHMTIPLVVPPVNFSLRNSWVYDPAPGGNRDSVATPSERIQPRIRLANDGPENAQNVVATLTTTDPSITVLSGTVDHGTWNAGAARNNEGLELLIAYDADAHSALLELTVTADNGGPWVFSVAMPVVAGGPAPVFAQRSSWIFDPESGGNRNGKMEPGERVRPRVRMINTGDLVARNVTVTLASDDPDVSVRIGEMTYSGWSAGLARNNGGFVVFVEPDATAHDVLFQVSVTSDNAAPLNYTVTLPIHQAADLNSDGVVSIADILVAATLLDSDASEHGEADLNEDDRVDFADMMLVADARNDIRHVAPASTQRPIALVERWIEEARRADDGSALFRDGIAALMGILGGLRPEATALLPNYPNPFNPETWIPFDLSEAADVVITIYSARGEIVRRIDLGRMDVGSYRDRSRAAYWDGSNSVGETVASGAYIYELRADEQRHARRMVIWK
ncbi:S8 family serine peptidase [Candidatus Poribacteria bacterium]|nr:S8 family serine peptidase [Candidatus Poribacteria bacterium]MBT5533497.1 S8 family serine peptidase [Candidatus Poribacteria bacterium]MBT5710133.1 S8 family serine peptidase [Candidatus Poribacteria bacterium]MBT7100538.1 S8 family serine peptidase [Candidatus Poribacteria bacterium]MBT7808894.1 S8 family serine peptidase [Candidatus Poribacteria bacterium]